MEFTRKKRRGMNRKVQRLWLSAEKYRITWRREAFGITLPPRFQACVRVIVPGTFENGFTEMWDFVNARRLYKSMKAAIADCEKHHRLWTKATQCTGIRAIRELFGRDPTSIPVWAKTKLDRRILGILLDTTPRKYVDTGEDELPKMPLTPEIPTPPKKRKQRSDKEKPRANKKRKTRSDKGKPRGPRKPKEVINGD